MTECKQDAQVANLYHSAGKINAVEETRTNDHNIYKRISLSSNTKSPIAGYSNTQTSTYFFDQLDSTALVTDHQFQDKIIAIKYDTYGESSAVKRLNPSLSFGFAQEFLDHPSGLIYLRSRYYSPKQKSFSSMDTYHRENRYTYCDGDPINYIDPMGHFPWRQMFIPALGIAGSYVTGLVVATTATLMLSNKIVR